jgi:hypothetical protein
MYDHISRIVYGLRSLQALPLTETKHHSFFYKGNSNSKVNCLIPALSWQAWVQLAHTCIHHHTAAAAGKSVSGGLTVTCMKTNTRHMGSTLALLQHYEECGKTFISRNVKGDLTWVLTPDNKVELMMNPLQKTVLSPWKGMATIVWDVYRVLSVHFTPHGSTINAAPYQ